MGLGGRKGEVMHYFGRRFDTGLPVCVEIEGGRVVRVMPAPAGMASLGAWPWIGPGLLDIQVNGFGGSEFSSANLTVEQVAEIGTSLMAFGVTRYCPTVTTQHFDVLAHAMRTIAAACDQMPRVAGQVAGIHLEGPYLSTEDGPRGAHPREHCRRRIGTISAAPGGGRGTDSDPDNVGGVWPAPRFIEQVVPAAWWCSIGHTSAIPGKSVGRSMRGPE